MINIVSLSGGKDSVALWLWARREGLNPVAVYIDTGWEWDGHAAHLDMLERRLGPIHRIAPRRVVLLDRKTAKRRFKSGRRMAGRHMRMPPKNYGRRVLVTFEDFVRFKGTFPSRVRKWCSEELKLKPFREWLDGFRDRTGDDVQVLLGIRRDESARRADSLEREYSDFYDCDVWRPILDWTVQQVIEEHRRALIPMHPLYHEGAERVGCFPCVNAPKSELAMVGRLAPERIALIREIEADTDQTMFTRDRRAEKHRQGDNGPSVVPIGIDEVIAWANTARGGKQLALVRTPTGCARWGTCERPVDDGGES